MSPAPGTGRPPPPRRESRSHRPPPTHPGPSRRCPICRPSRRPGQTPPPGWVRRAATGRTASTTARRASARRASVRRAPGWTTRRVRPRPVRSRRTRGNGRGTRCPRHRRRSRGPVPIPRTPTRSPAVSRSRPVRCRRPAAADPADSSRRPGRFPPPRRWPRRHPCRRPPRRARVRRGRPSRHRTRVAVARARPSGAAPIRGTATAPRGCARFPTAMPRPGQQAVRWTSRRRPIRPHRPEASVRTATRHPSTRHPRCPAGAAPGPGAPPIPWGLAHRPHLESPRWRRAAGPVSLVPMTPAGVIRSPTRAASCVRCRRPARPRLPRTGWIRCPGRYPGCPHGPGEARSAQVPPP